VAAPNSDSATPNSSGKLTDRLTEVDQLGRPRTGRGRRAAGRRGPGRRVIRRARNVPTLEMPGSGYLGGQPSTASEPGLPNTHLAGQRGWISPIGPKPSCGVSM
jgi:hypothetical protein